MITRISVLIPTKNEAQTIGDVIERCRLVLEPYAHEIVVIDKSTDDSARLAEKAGAVVSRQVDSGVGSALTRGFQLAKGDIIIFLDGDGTYQPEDIPAVIDPIIRGVADLVNGNRFGKMEAGAMTRLNYVGNKALSSLANQLLGTNIRDSQSGMKALTRALIRKTVLRQRGFAINSEILAEATRVAGRVAEVPISYRKRKGQTKLNPLREGLLITASIVTFLRDHDPLLLFGGIGTLLVVVGLVLAWPVVTEYLEFRTFTLIGRALLAALCWLMGVLLIVSGLLLNALNYSLRKIEEKIGRIE